jgi:hypothetical protein
VVPEAVALEKMPVSFRDLPLELLPLAFDPNDY